MDRSTPDMCISSIALPSKVFEPVVCSKKVRHDVVIRGEDPKLAGYAIESDQSAIPSSTLHHRRCQRLREKAVGLLLVLDRIAPAVLEPMAIEMIETSADSKSVRD